MKKTFLSIAAVSIVAVVVFLGNAMTAEAATPGKFTGVSVSSSSSTESAATILTITFTTENAISSGDSDIMRLNWEQFDTSNASLDSLTIGGVAAGTTYEYSSSSYYEFTPDTNIGAGVEVVATVSGFTNRSNEGTEYVSLVSFSPSGGGTAYENCTDAGGGDQTYGDCTPYQVYIPVGTPVVQGQLKGPVGSADANKGIYNAYVEIWNYGGVWDTLNSDHLGMFYFFNQPTDTYRLYFQIPSGVAFTYSAPAEQDISVTNGQTTNVGVIRFQNPSVQGVVKRQDNNQPIEDVGVSFMNVPMQETTTDSSGGFYLPSVDPGTYTVMFRKPGGANGEGLISPDPISVTVTSGSVTNIGTIYFATANKTIKGYVLYPNGNPVTDAQVGCSKPMGGDWYTAMTNASGYYELLIGKGSWHCMAEHDWSMPWDYDWDWVNFQMPSTITFSQENSVTEIKRNDFEVTQIDATIVGKILKPDGTVFSGGGNIMVDVYTQHGFGTYAQVNQQDGTFSVGVPGGTYMVSFNLWHDTYGSPSPETVTVASNSTKNIGTKYLLEKKARISGSVTTDSGDPIANTFVDCFVPNEWGKWSSATTNSSGDFTMKTFGEYTWMCNPMSDMGGSSGSGVTYIYLGAPLTIVLATETQHSQNNDFEMTTADATVNVTAVDPSGDQIDDLFGFAFIDRGIGDGGMDSMFMGPGLGGPIDNGSGSFKVPSTMCPSSSPCNVNIASPPGPGSEYSSGGAVAFSVTTNGTANVDVEMLPHNATISGNIVDASGTAVTGVSAFVFAEKPGTWAFNEAVVNTANGSYSMSTAAGSYYMGAFVDPTQGYVVSGMADNSVTAIANQTVEKDIVLAEIDATVRITTVDPDGNPMSGVFVDVSSDSGAGGLGAPDMHGGPMMGPGMMGEMTGSDGTVSIGVPAGDGATLYAFASLPPEMGYISPSSETIEISSGETVSKTMTFKVSDASIAGSVTLDGSPVNAFISAWSESGGTALSYAYSGSYTVNVTQGDVWHINAKLMSGNDFYKSGEKAIDVDEALESLNLELELAVENIPDPVTATFDPTNPAVVTVGDTTINIPAASIASSGNNVTVTATPTVEVNDTAQTRQLDYAIDTKAYQDNTEIQSQFNSDVTFTRCFDEDYLDGLGVETNQLSQNYYNDDSGSWVTPDTVSQDETNHCVTTSVNHFTNFAVTSSAMAAPGLTVTTEDNTTVTVPTIIIEGTVSDPNATVTVTLNAERQGGAIIRSLILDDVEISASDGSFSETVTGLLVGENTISVTAENSIGEAAPSSITVTYVASEDEEENPTTEATGVELEFVVIAEHGGPQIRVFDNEGNVLASFFAFGENLRGEFKVVTVDVNGDGDKEIVVYPASGYSPHIRVFDNRGNFIGHFFAYQEGYKTGIEVKTGDVDGDGRSDLIVWPNGGGGPNVRVYTFNSAEWSFELLDWFWAYGETYTGTFKLIASDIDRDNDVEIVTVPDSGGPNVRVYTYNAITGEIELLDWFMAYDESFRGDINIAVGNVVTGDSKEIIIAPAFGGGPNVRVYSYNSGSFSLDSWFWAYSETYRGGVDLKLTDLDNDGLSDIITTPTSGGPNVRIFHEDTTTSDIMLLDWFYAYGEGYRNGMVVNVANVDGDDYNEIVITPKESSSPNVRLYEWDATDAQFELLDWFWAYDEAYHGTVNVKVADVEGDGNSEIITAPALGHSPNVRVFNYASGDITTNAWFWAFAETFRGGVKITTGI